MSDFELFLAAFDTYWQRFGSSIHPTCHADTHLRRQLMECRATLTPAPPDYPPPPPARKPGDGPQWGGAKCACRACRSMRGE